MEKEYVTARLFKNHRAADCVNTDEEVQGSDEQQSTEAQNSLGENSETGEPNSHQNIPDLPQKLLDVIRRALEGLCLDHKK